MSEKKKKVNIFVGFSHRRFLTFETAADHRRFSGRFSVGAVGAPPVLKFTEYLNSCEWAKIPCGTSFILLPIQWALSYPVKVILPN